MTLDREYLFFFYSYIFIRDCPFVGQSEKGSPLEQDRATYRHNCFTYIGILSLPLYQLHPASVKRTRATGFRHAWRDNKRNISISRCSNIDSRSFRPIISRCNLYRKMYLAYFFSRYSQFTFLHRFVPRTNNEHAFSRLFYLFFVRRGILADGSSSNTINMYRPSGKYTLLSRTPCRSHYARVSLEGRPTDFTVVEWRRGRANDQGSVLGRHRDEHVTRIAHIRA